MLQGHYSKMLRKVNHLARISKSASSLPSGAMKTTSDIRRENARRLAREAGSNAQLAREMGMSDSQMGQLIGENPTRNIGPNLARRLEAGRGKQTGWMDLPHEEAVIQSLRVMQLGELRRIAEALSDSDLSHCLAMVQENYAHLALEKDQTLGKVNSLSTSYSGNIVATAPHEGSITKEGERSDGRPTSTRIKKPEEVVPSSRKKGVESATRSKTRKGHKA